MRPGLRNLAAALAALTLTAVISPASAMDATRASSHKEPSGDTVTVSGSPTAAHKRDTDVDTSSVGWELSESPHNDAAVIFDVTLNDVSDPYKGAHGIVSRFVYTDADGRTVTDVQTVSSVNGYGGESSYFRTVDGVTTRIDACSPGYLAMIGGGSLALGSLTPWKDCLQSAPSMQVTAYFWNRRGDTTVKDVFFTGTMTPPTAARWRTHVQNDPKHDAGYTSMYGAKDFAEVRSATSSYNPATERVKVVVAMAKVSTKASQPRIGFDFWSEGPDGPQMRARVWVPKSHGRPGSIRVNGGNCEGAKVSTNVKAGKVVMSWPANCVHGPNFGLSMNIGSYWRGSLLNTDMVFDWAGIRLS